MDIGLVLEGGGMRGVYTAGVLECFLENDIEFPYVIGVSAGACNAASYLSKQKGRNKKVNIGFVKDPRYISWRNYLMKRELFGMDYIFDEIPNRLVPFDYEAFHQNKAEFVIGTTDCMSGEPVYLHKKDYERNVLMAIRASSSLPFVANEIQFKGRLLLDGGISDPVPLRKAQEDGYSKNIVILTRNMGYLKKRSRFTFLVKKKYPQYSGLFKAMSERYKKYNEIMVHLAEEEKKGNVLIIRPLEPLKVSRVERNPLKLEELYNQGFNDAQLQLERIKKFQNHSESIPS
ncbi:patatin-like phospholipase family protein [Falsibacillus albus]|uniref:Patatin family protein n=1 Tax=Falsibacillus albus TaxID=2478915 RepID=A0A3L7K3G3_9BACI|nr:patatin family protein [Falsibacillus albus]RLQ95252.1 patatin family protein [Falsibacillus albus]